jgi:hypothetical protein
MACLSWVLSDSDSCLGYMTLLLIFKEDSLMVS